jgi:hypothetical protein
MTKTKLENLESLTEEEIEFVTGGVANQSVVCKLPADPTDCGTKGPGVHNPFLNA